MTNGNHLRFAFARDRGFPWYGYYLFRRLHSPGKPQCLQSSFNPGWKVGPWPAAQVAMAQGVFSSDVNLVFTDQFPPSGAPEFDLRRREYLRFTLPAAASAGEFHVTLGWLDETDRKPPAPVKQCIGFDGLKPGQFANPYISGGVTFTALDRKGVPVKTCDVRAINGTLGIFSTGQVSVKLPVPSTAIEVTLSSSDASTQVLALDERGNVVAKGAVAGQAGKAQVVSLSAKAISSITISAAKIGFYVERACYTATAAARPLLGPITLTGFHDQVPVAQVKVTGSAGDVVQAVVSADLMTAIEISGGPAVLIDLCLVSPASNLALGWTPLVPKPLCLPVEHAAYPCPGKPSNFAQARAMALARIHYGVSADWGGQRYTDLNGVLNNLVMQGPSGLSMADRVVPFNDSSGAVNPPTMPPQSPLDIVLVGSLHPAIAMMLGLYWVDITAQAGVNYDYMVVADHSGRFHGHPAEALAALAAVAPQSPLPADVDVWVCANLAYVAAPPLPPPALPQVFALPGASTGGAPPSPPGGTNMAGIRWSIPAAPDGTVLPGGPIGYHLWRTNVAATQPTTVPPSTSYHAVDPNRMIITTEIEPPVGVTPTRASDWPPFPLLAIDRGLTDGWYSYRLSAVDIFGRYSALGNPGAWMQWSPAPDPKPWYYIDPPADITINPFAVALFDRTPPPRPPGVMATALDPDDPMVVKDSAYAAWWSGPPSGWWNSPTPADRVQRLGLRVQWRWTNDQMIQAPDTAEFRLYFDLGNKPPGTDYSDPLIWQDRIFVVGYGHHVTVTTDADGHPLRLYDVLLPASEDLTFPGVPLEASDAIPIAYALIGVSAADNRTHTADNPLRSTGPWSNRPGNEGPVGAPAKIYRVLRTPPPPPAAVDSSEKVWATRADYHSRSYYTFRWPKSATLKAHIFRALDDTLFQIDWQRRQSTNPPPLDSTILTNFPIATWNQPTRDAIAAELNGLPTPIATASFDSAARAPYGNLSNNALRTLAGLPGNEKAFSQITYTPLDPADALNADRAGPDGTDAYAPNSALCAYTAELNGRARNRYFFRAAYVNGAHTVGPLSPSSPPVYLPKVEPPRTPVITKVLGGDLAITVTWALNREPDLAEYRIYRTDDPRKTADVRLMTFVHTEVPSLTPPTGPSVSMNWTDLSVQALVTYFYRLVAVDNVGNTSNPSPSSSARAFDDSRPTPPGWNPAVPGGAPDQVVLSWISSDPNLSCLVERSPLGLGQWQNASGWLARGTYAFTDTGRLTGTTYDYRLRVLDNRGQQNNTFSTLTA